MLFIALMFSATVNALYSKENFSWRTDNLLEFNEELYGEGFKNSSELIQHAEKVKASYNAFYDAMQGSDFSLVEQTFETIIADLERFAELTHPELTMSGLIEVIEGEFIKRRYREEKTGAGNGGENGEGIYTVKYPEGYKPPSTQNGKVDTVEEEQPGAVDEGKGRQEGRPLGEGAGDSLQKAQPPAGISLYTVMIAVVLVLIVSFFIVLKKYVF